MDYDYRNRPASVYRPGASGGPAASSSSSSSFYPRVGQSGPPPAVGRGAPYLHPAAAAPAPAPGPPSSSAPGSGLGIKVVIKPEYYITPPPQLSPQMPEVPRSTFQYDFDFEKRILAEAEKDYQGWSRIAAESHLTKPAASTPSVGSSGDPIVDKYLASGLAREPVSLAVLNYGDNPVKVREFVKGYNILREMGFPSKSVGEALAMYDNDTDKALAQLINS